MHLLALPDVIDRKGRCACMAMTAGPPYTAEEVLDLFEQGKLSPAEAFSLFRRLETGRAPRPTQAPTAVPRPKATEEDDEQARRRRLREVEEELGRLIGLTSVKRLVKE